MARLARKQNCVLGKNHGSNLGLVCRFGGASTLQELCRVLDLYRLATERHLAGQIANTSGASAQFFIGCATSPANTGPCSYKRYFSEVTTPKFPLPPRRAQNKSAFSSSLATSNFPSAVTMSIEIRLSQANPCLPMSQPNPPPNVSPVIPVIEMVPSVVARPNASVSRSNSAKVSPGSQRATRRLGSILIVFIRDRS